MIIIIIISSSSSSINNGEMSPHSSLIAVV